VEDTAAEKVGKRVLGHPASIPMAACRTLGLDSKEERLPLAADNTSVLVHHEMGTTWNAREM
jgi:hypothetical protein